MKTISYLISCLCLVLPLKVNSTLAQAPIVITGSQILGQGDSVVVFPGRNWNYTAIATSFLENAYTSQTASIICNGMYSITIPMATYKVDNRTAGLFIFDGSQNLLLVNENESPQSFTWSLTINKIP